jgi:outer membrane protein assembly factor BamA
MSDTKFSSSNPTDLDFDLQTSALGERCYVEDVFLSGLKRTNESLVRRELIGLGSASTLQEIKDSLVQVHQSLQTLGIFDAVEITVDKSEKVRWNMLAKTLSLHFLVGPLRNWPI